MKRGIITLLIAALSLFMFTQSFEAEGKKPKRQSPKVNTSKIDMQVFQTLDKHVALANTKGDGYTIYLGDVCMVMSETEIMYDNRVFKDSFVLVGTYSYETRSGIMKTVPAYVLYSEYKNIINSGRSIENVFFWLDK